jgi:hypothetical protein
MKNTSITNNIFLSGRNSLVRNIVSKGRKFHRSLKQRQKNAELATAADKRASSIILAPSSERNISERQGGPHARIPRPGLSTYIHTWVGTYQLEPVTPNSVSRPSRTYVYLQTEYLRRKLAQSGHPAAG